jgi:lipoprotein-releasing system permease protein
MFKQMPYEWQVGWRHVRGAGGYSSNRFIAFIARVSMLGIALGVAALIVLLSVVKGFQVEVRDRMLGMVPHISVVQRGGLAMDVAGLSAAAKQTPGVRASAPAAIGEALLGRGENLRGVALRGIDPAQEGKVSPVVRELAPALLAGLSPGSQNIILGFELARALGVQAGDRVVVVRPGTAASNAPVMTPVNVIGTFKVGHFEFDNTLALLHQQDAAALLGLNGPNALHVQITDALQAPQIAAELQNQIGFMVGVRDWTQVNRNWFESVQLQRRMLALILTLIVAVAAFNLVSTLVMTVTDKRGEIAILRTLGASPRSVMAIFVVQGLLAGLVGTGGGVALGLLIANHLDTLIPALERLLGTTLLTPSVYLLDHMPSLPQAADVVPVAVVSLVLSLLATLYPSWRASRLRPAQALRGE